MKLEKLSHVNLREQWADEARDFTPWLAGEEGLKLLGEALGMELELEDTEVSVGNYRADIVAKDSLSNDYVVISLIPAIQGIYLMSTGALPASTSGYVETAIWCVFAALFYFYSQKGTEKTIITPDSEE